MDPSRSDRTLSILLHIGFLISGIVTVLIGQVLPILSRHYQLTDLYSGFYFPAQFAGSLAGTLLTALFARRDNYLLATGIGSGLMAAGILLLNIDSFSVSLAAFVVTGMGIGLTLPAINMTIIEMNPLRAAAALSILNFFWGVGAILCKPFVDLTVRDASVVFTTALLAAPLLCLGAYFALRPRPGIGLAHGSEEEEPEDNGPIWTTPLAWAIAGFNFVHVGFESSMGGWLTTYSGRVQGADATMLVSPTVMYFVMFVAGRGIAPLLFRFLNETRMLFLGLLLILGGILMTVTADSFGVLSLGAAISGFGTSWVFPTNVSRFSSAFGKSATRRATPLFVCGTLGSALTTWLIGYVSDRTGDLRSGMYVLVASVVLLIGLQAAIAAHTARRHRSAEIE